MTPEQEIDFLKREKERVESQGGRSMTTAAKWVGPHHVVIVREEGARPTVYVDSVPLEIPIPDSINNGFEHYNRALSSRELAAIWALDSDNRFRQGIAQQAPIRHSPALERFAEQERRALQKAVTVYAVGQDPRPDSRRRVREVFRGGPGVLRKRAELWMEPVPGPSVVGTSEIVPESRGVGSRPSTVTRWQLVVGPRFQEDEGRAQLLGTYKSWGEAVTAKHRLEGKHGKSERLYLPGDLQINRVLMVE